MSEKRRSAEEFFEALSKTGEALKYSCESNMGVLDLGFLCKSIGSLGLSDPLTVQLDSSVDKVMKELKSHKVGCVLVVDADGKLQGIFSERDYVIKVHGKKGAGDEPVSNYMTPDPIAERPDATIAFALNLMSQGGFRHLPIVEGKTALWESFLSRMFWIKL